VVVDLSPANLVNRRVQHLIKRIFRSFGYDLLTLGFAREFLPNHHLSRLFERLQIRCVLDVGANIGQYHDFLREKVGFEGAIISFEPVPRHVEILKTKAVSDKRWTIHGFALGQESGDSEIYVMEGGELSSFLSPLQTSPAMTVKNRVKVPIKTLDSVLDLVEKTCAIESTYLKVDTQGFDLNVLRGGSRALSRIPALQIEVSLLPIYEKMPSFRDVYDHLTSQGFDLSAMFPVSRDEILRAREFDCVFVNGRRLSKSI
jgi:FkbM family methyltransferase